MNFSDVETAVKLVSGVVSAVSGGLSISAWLLKNARPNVNEQLRRDLERIDAADFAGWVDVDQWTPESLFKATGEPEFLKSPAGYCIEVYHDELDELDRIEIREPGAWRADGVDRLRKVLGIDLR